MIRLHLLPFASAIDFATTCWIASIVVLILVMLRYIRRIHLACNSWRDVYWESSAAISMLVYDVGNLLLLCWFWRKTHSGELHAYGTELDSATLFLGCFISFMGLLCKVRVFSDSPLEAVISTAVIVAMSTVSAFGYAFGWF